MKKRMLFLPVFIALLAIVLIAGCGTQASTDSPNLTSDKFAQINIGMSSDQVKSMAGEPSRTEAKNMSGGHSMGEGTMSGNAMSMEYWYYQGSKGWGRLEIADGKVTAKSGY